MSWIEGNYRRNLMDMHIDDWNPEFLSKINVDEYVQCLKDCGAQAAMIKGKPHTGLCYYPTKIGRMHKGLKGYDFFGHMVEACHKNGIIAEGYYSQIFDNWAYETHPEWRLVTADGKNYREYRNQGNFKTGRYGICCPNNEGYRQYVKDSLTELVGKYDIDGIFLDMTFWPEICYCPTCRKKYKDLTGKEIPREVNWDDPDFREFAYIRDQWMAEFAKFSTDCVKKIRPACTVEHQFSRITCSWADGSTEMLTEASDYSGGDYYGGYLQQTFINKYYKSVSPNLPFIYHTSRCDPELSYHTTTKTEEQLLLHVITALVHNGAFLLVDAINPDGSIVPSIYHDTMKKVYAQTKPYEKFVSGKLNHNASIWFASHAKYDPEEKCAMMDRAFEPHFYLEGPVAVTSILRDNNIPFDVIGTKNIRSENAGVLILSHVANIRDEEMREIEAYIKKGGNLLISGPIANERLQKILGVEVIGLSDSDFTYMSPTEEGKEFFKGFDVKVPLTTPERQTIIKITDNTDLTVLATMTLPYTATHTRDFAAIHSNPPGVYTDSPCAVLKKVGKSRIIWTAAPIEMAKPYLSRQVYAGMVKYLAGDLAFTSNAPKFVEIISWEKEGRTFFAAINEQEESPVAPMYEITVTVPGRIRGAKLIPAVDDPALQAEQSTDLAVTFDEKADTSTIALPKLEVFEIFEVMR